METLFLETVRAAPLRVGSHSYCVDQQSASRDPQSVVDALSPQHTAFGAAVRQLRSERGLSQERLGQTSGLHRNYVGGVERGELNPSLASILKLAAAFGIEASELLALSERLGRSTT